jgi:hypothetical protein
MLGILLDWFRVSHHQDLTFMVKDHQFHTLLLNLHHPFLHMLLPLLLLWSHPQRHLPQLLKLIQQFQMRQSLGGKA